MDDCANSVQRRDDVASIRASVGVQRSVKSTSAIVQS